MPGPWVWGAQQTEFASARTSWRSSLRAGPVALELTVGGYAFAYAAGMLTLTMLLQGWFGLTPFRAGLAFAPMGVTFSITALLGRPLAARYGQRVIGGGCAIAATGLILLTVHPGLALVIVAAGIAGAGNGLSFRN